jgi:hypothetical protein
VIGADTRAPQRGAVADAGKAGGRYTVGFSLRLPGSISGAIAIYAKPCVDTGNERSTGRFIPGCGLRSLRERPAAKQLRRGPEPAPLFSCCSFAPLIHRPAETDQVRIVNLTSDFA